MNKAEVEYRCTNGHAWTGPPLPANMQLGVAANGVMSFDSGEGASKLLCLRCVKRWVEEQFGIVTVTTAKK